MPISLSTVNGQVNSCLKEDICLMIFHSEQGAFDSFEHEHLPRTKYDVMVDESSNKPAEQAFEVGSA